MQTLEEFKKEMAERVRRFEAKYGIHIPTWDELARSEKYQKRIDEETALAMSARDLAKKDFNRRFPDITLDDDAHRN